MKQILVRTGEQVTLAAIFKCCRKTVNEALQFKTNTPLAVRIRKAAIERGGKETVYTNE